MAVQEKVTRTPALSLSRKQLGQVRTDLVGWGFAAPFLLAYGLFIVWPILDGLRLSFYSWSLLGTSHFIGLDNYRALFQDNLFWSAVWHTIQFTLLSTPPLVVLGLIMALLANRKLPLRWLFRLAFFSPYVLPASIVYLIWNWLYQSDYGLLNSLVTRLGFPQINWLTDPGMAMTSIVIATVWWTVGFNFILYLAGLQDIPQELYEAAAIDGAGAWASLRYITIPLLQRTSTLIIILQVLASLKIFDQIYLFTTGGPEGITRPILEYIYEIGFQSYRLGYAAAMSYIFFIFILIVSAAQFILLNRRRVVV